MNNRTYWIDVAALLIVLTAGIIGFVELDRRCRAIQDRLDAKSDLKSDLAIDMTAIKQHQSDVINVVKDQMKDMTETSRKHLIEEIKAQNAAILAILDKKPEPPADRLVLLQKLAEVQKQYVDENTKGEGLLAKINSMRPGGSLADSSLANDEFGDFTTKEKDKKGNQK